MRGKQKEAVTETKQNQLQEAKHRLLLRGDGT